MDDCWALDLNKRDTWKCILPGKITLTRVYVILTHIKCQVKKNIFLILFMLLYLFLFVCTCMCIFTMCIPGTMHALQWKGELDGADDTSDNDSDEEGSGSDEEDSEENSNSDEESSEEGSSGSESEGEDTEHNSIQDQNDNDGVDGDMEDNHNMKVSDAAGVIASDTKLNECTEHGTPKKKIKATDVDSSTKSSSKKKSVANAELSDATVARGVNVLKGGSRDRFGGRAAASSGLVAELETIRTTELPNNGNNYDIPIQ